LAGANKSWQELVKAAVAGTDIRWMSFQEQEGGSWKDVAGAGMS